MDADNVCPICQQRALDQDRQSWRICRICGEYDFPNVYLPNLQSLSDRDKELLRYLPAYVRQRFEDTGQVVKLYDSNWQDFARLHEATSIPQKMDKLLSLLSKRSHVAGEKVSIDCSTEYPLVDAVSADEYTQLLRYLQDLEYVDHISDNSVRIGFRGWQKLEPPMGGRGIPGQSFVAMWFDESLSDAYELGIKAAVKDCNCPEPIRVDRVQHNDKICDRILADITRCEFVIVDCTGFRSGAFFEAGFAKGLGREVIWLCREDYFKNLGEHFDTRQYNHIEWKDPKDLRRKLTDRIRGTILAKRQ